MIPQDIDREIFLAVRDRIGTFAVDILPDACYYNSDKLDDATEDIMQLIIRALDNYLEKR
jgi:hypothetical protein